MTQEAIMQTNPGQWAVELWRKACHDYGGASIDDSPAEWRAVIAIQTAFAEREARLVGALGIVGKVLPSAAGLDDAPDSKIIACYMSMGEMRAIKEALAALKDRT